MRPQLTATSQEKKLDKKILATNVSVTIMNMNSKSFQFVDQFNGVVILYPRRWIQIQSKELSITRVFSLVILLAGSL